MGKPLVETYSGQSLILILRLCRSILIWYAWRTGHTDVVNCLAVGNNRLYSGSDDRSETCLMLPNLLQLLPALTLPWMSVLLLCE